MKKCPHCFLISGGAPRRGARARLRIGEGPPALLVEGRLSEATGSACARLAALTRALRRSAPPPPLLLFCLCGRDLSRPYCDPRASEKRPSAPCRSFLLMRARFIEPLPQPARFGEARIRPGRPFLFVRARFIAPLLQPARFGEARIRPLPPLFVHAGAIHRAPAAGAAGRAGQPRARKKGGILSDAP